VVAGESHLYVITAAHVLPYVPTPLALEEAIYRSLLGPLAAIPTVWAQCVFVDPVADIAVLGPPDHQELPNQFEAYQALLNSVGEFSVADAPLEGAAWLYSLDRGGSNAASIGSRRAPLGIGCR
jgi:hypothetical protein